MHLTSSLRESWALVVSSHDDGQARTRESWALVVPSHGDGQSRASESWKRVVSPHAMVKTHAPKDGGSSLFVLSGNQIYLLGCHFHAITAFQLAESQNSAAASQINFRVRYKKKSYKLDILYCNMYFKRYIIMNVALII
jgi:hypothetical protein